jgi:hypothetical protein
MSNPLVEGLLLLAFWAPPLAVVVGALMLIVPKPVEQSAALPRYTAPVTH